MNKSCGTCLENIIFNEFKSKAHVGRENEWIQARKVLLVIKGISPPFLNENSKPLEYRIFKTWSEICIYYCDNLLDCKVQNKVPCKKIVIKLCTLVLNIYTWSLFRQFSGIVYSYALWIYKFSMKYSILDSKIILDILNNFL